MEMRGDLNYYVTIGPGPRMVESLSKIAAHIRSIVLPAFGLFV